MIGKAQPRLHSPESTLSLLALASKLSAPVAIFIFTVVALAF